MMLRSQLRAAKGGDGLRGLSSQLGSGFSANGDHIAFLSGTKERINLTYGPVTTSYGQFNADAPRADGFHQVEDQGVPRALLTLVAAGMPGLEALAEGNRFEALLKTLRAAYRNYTRRRPHDPDRAADLSAERAPTDNERSSNILCVVAQGKDAANGRLRLEGERLRLSRKDGKRYDDDPIYVEIKASLARFAEKLRPEGSQARFLAPLSEVKIPFLDRMVLTSHPLGGCPMGETVDNGVVDEHGRVLRTTSAGGGVHRGLYIADGSILPTALGVNPALTISAVALHVAKKVLEEWDQTATPQPRKPAAFECDVKSPSTA
jgi:cholesterol oxidase